MKTHTQPKADTWAIKAPIADARSHSPTAAYEDKIYIFGGGGPNFASKNTSYVYDPSTDQWARIADMPTLRSGAVTAVSDDRVYILGGGFKQPNGQFKFLTTVEIYYPKTDTWESGPDLLQPHDYPAVATLNGYIYVLGGHHPDATKAGPKTDPGFDFCERLNLSTQRWEAIAPLNQPRFALSAEVVDGKILTMAGVAFTPEGFNNFTLVEAYDPAQNRWSEDTHHTLPWPAAGQATCIAHGQLYLFGGYSTDNIHSRAARFNATSGQWERIADLPAPRAATGVAVVKDTIYLVGGWADDGRTPQDSLFTYQIA